MPLSLRPWQWAALPYLEWLLNDTARQSGRSTTIAIALIRLACRHPRRVIRFWDHALSTRDAQGLIRRSVRALVEEDPQLQGRYNGTQVSFWLNLSEPLLNWLPEAAPGIDHNIDRFPPPVISIPPYLIGGRDSQESEDPTPNDCNYLSQVLAIAPTRVPEILRARRRIWNDNVDALRYALEIFRQSPLEEPAVLRQPEEHAVLRQPEEPEVPPTSVLDRLLAGAEDP